MNITILRGILASEPSVTELADGTVVRNYEVAASDREGSRQVVPVVWVESGRPPVVRKGDAVAVVGAVRRRWFRSSGTTVSRTEVLATTIGKDNSKRVATAIDAALDWVAGVGSPG